MLKVLHWAPRITGILGILFLSLFSLDVFEAGVPLTHILVGFLVHNIPSLVLIPILAVAWRYERIGGYMFIAISLMPFFLLSNPVWVNAILCGPFLLTGVLFLVSDRYYRDSASPVEI
jgi:hypothetical protein